VQYLPYFETTRQDRGIEIPGHHKLYRCCCSRKNRMHSVRNVNCKINEPFFLGWKGGTNSGMREYTLQHGQA